MMKIKNPFFFGLMTSLVVFALMTLGFVFWTTTVSWGLVSEDYYDEEILYQEQIDRIKLTMELPEKVRFIPTDSGIEIIMPQQFNKDDLIGKVVLFRPSNHRLDKNYNLSLDKNGKFTIPVNDIPLNGLWKIKVQWELEGKQYYFEEEMIL